MIIKGSQRGGGRDLADHLMKTHENDHIELYEMRGFASSDLAGAFLEIEVAASLTRCTKPFFSVIYNPPEGHAATKEDFRKAMDLTEDKFPELKGQPRIEMFHEKEGRLHCHVVWSRIDCERNRAINLSHTRLRLQDVSRAMYAHMGLEAPAGFRDRSKADPLNYDIRIWQQARRLGEDPRDLKQIIQDAWARSDSRAGFEHALEQNALHLARGDKRGFVVVHHSGEPMSLTKYGDLGTRELKARLGDPEKLPTLGQVQTALFTKTTAVTARRHGEMVRRHREELRPLSDEHRRMKEAHRGQRQELGHKQAERSKQEAQGRSQRLRTGIMGLWDRLSGKRGKVSELNARDMAAGRTRDNAEQENLKTGQRQERGELQGRIVQMRDRHRRDRQQHRAELGAMLSMAKDSVRDSFMEHGRELEDRKRNPPTAAQTRRDRAEKRGTMPEIAASERTRRADARAEREARKSTVEGREGGTGETTPGNEQAPTARPEAAREANSGEGQEAQHKPKTGWANEAERDEARRRGDERRERQAAIERERERQKAQDRDYSNDNDTGRTREP